MFPAVLSCTRKVPQIVRLAGGYCNDLIANHMSPPAAVPIPVRVEPKPLPTRIRGR